MTSWSARAVTVLALALSTAACERGCLSRRMEESGSPTTGGVGPRGSQGPDGSSSFDLAGTDCSAGLARCVDGRVETSLARHIPYPCVAPAGRERGGACECPWENAGQCATGCVKEGLEVVAATPEVARVQLCAATSPVIRPVTASESVAAQICAEANVSCGANIVRTCSARGQPERLVAGCVVGCATGIALEPEDVGTDGSEVAAVLCQRAHAERR